MDNFRGYKINYTHSKLLGKCSVFIYKNGKSIAKKYNLPNKDNAVAKAKELIDEDIKEKSQFKPKGQFKMLKHERINFKEKWQSIKRADRAGKYINHKAICGTIVFIIFLIAINIQG